ncbi:MAG: RsmE family RNA methyltransferase [Eubacteriales bacterium]|nr:RsmE family RNA methyltransferase [Eubacteriales bacterium]MDD4511645.1 RsmE family RNA methyltransferase [Eubacteriales bacterium]
MHRFFADETENPQTFTLGRDESRHAARVLRLAEGDEIEALSGGRIFTAELTLVDEKRCELRLISETGSREAKTRVTLFQGLPKAEKMELILQKATEIGAAAVVPLKLSRCVARQDAGESSKKRARYEKIIREAQKQCGRGVCPDLYDAMTPSEAENLLTSRALLLMLWEEAPTGYGIPQALAENPDAGDIGIIIGHEGGITQGEAEQLIRIGAKPVSLGARILRTETAGLAALSAILALKGDLE